MNANSNIHQRKKKPSEKNRQKWKRVKQNGAATVSKIGSKAYVSSSNPCTGWFLGCRASNAQVLFITIQFNFPVTLNFQILSPQGIDYKKWMNKKLNGEIKNKLFSMRIRKVHRRKEIQLVPEWKLKKKGEKKDHISWIPKQKGNKKLGHEKLESSNRNDITDNSKKRSAVRANKEVPSSTSQRWKPRNTSKINVCLGWINKSNQTKQFKSWSVNERKITRKKKNQTGMTRDIQEADKV